MRITLHGNFKFITKSGVGRCMVCDEFTHDKEFCLIIKRKYSPKSAKNVTVHINCIKKLCKALTESKESYAYLNKKFEGMNVEYFRIGYLIVKRNIFPKCSYCNRECDGYGVGIHREWADSNIWIELDCVDKVVKLLRESMKKYEDVIIANML